MNTKLKDYLFELCATADRGDKIDYDESCEDITKLVLSESEEVKCLISLTVMIDNLANEADDKKAIPLLKKEIIKAREIISKYENQNQ